MNYDMKKKSKLVYKHYMDFIPGSKLRM